MPVLTSTSGTEREQWVSLLSNGIRNVRQLCRIFHAENTERVVISGLPGNSLLVWLLLNMLGMGAMAPREDKMKKTVLIAVLLLTGIALAFPQPGYAWGHRGWGGHRGGWYGPGAVIGAGIGAAAAMVGAGAAVVGAVVGGPGYGYPPPASYGYPPPAYGYPAPAYGYPYYGPRYYPGYGYRGYYGGRGYSYRGYGRRW